jgi:hypothetical protein
MALPSAKNSVATTTTPDTDLGLRAPAGQHGPAQRQREHDRHRQDLAGAAPPGLAGPCQFEQDREPCHAGYHDEVDLDLAECCGVRAGGQPDRVQRHHHCETGQADRRQNQHRFAGITGQQIEPEPPTQAEHHCGHRSHVISLTWC